MLELVFGSYLALAKPASKANSVNAKLAKVVFDSRSDRQVSITVVAIAKLVTPIS
jgi:hypothetical protein